MRVQSCIIYNSAHSQNYLFEKKALLKNARKHYWTLNRFFRIQIHFGFLDICLVNLKKYFKKFKEREEFFILECLLISFIYFENSSGFTVTKLFYHLNKFRFFFKFFRNIVLVVCQLYNAFIFAFYNLLKFTYYFCSFVTLFNFLGLILQVFVFMPIHHWR